MPPVLSIIASYGLTELTRSVVTNLQRERDVTRVLVVDNGGDYEAEGEEEVVRPGRNLGWLGACNLGLEIAERDGHEASLLLNNDTQLSPGFVAGLLAASVATGGVVAPVYDDHAVRGQHLDVHGPAAEYSPRPVERAVSVIDGTAVLLPRASAEALGPLDRRFRRHGWGAIEDWCLRARSLGVPLHVTERSYCEHARGVTADAVNVRYTHFAAAEMHYGLARKWGRSWSSSLPGSGHEPPQLRDLAVASAWHWIEVCGFATWLQRPPSAAS